MLRKWAYTLKHFRETAYHHHGNHPRSYLKFIYNSLFERNVFIVYSMDLTKELPENFLDPEFTVIKPTMPELDNLRRNTDWPREFYYDQIHGISRCYLVLCGHEVAYIHWVYVKGDPSRFLNLSEGVGELNYNTTLPKFRGRRLSAKVMLYIFHDLKEQGFVKAVGVIDSGNIASIKSAEAIPWPQAAKITTFGQFNRKIRI